MYLIMYSSRVVVTSCKTLLSTKALFGAVLADLLAYDQFGRVAVNGRTLVWWS